MMKYRLAGVLLAGAVAAGGAGLFIKGLPASADVNTAVQLDHETASLFLPESYEQYLELDSPVDIAISARYVAIAEKEVLYLFDRNEKTPVYHTYEHATGHTGAQISKIQFSENEELYFSDSLLGFYKLDLTDLDKIAPTTDKPLASLSTFYIENDTVFEVSVVHDGTTYLTAPLSDPGSGTPFFHDNYTNTPQLGFSNGSFYSVVERLVNIFYFDSETGKYTVANQGYILQYDLSGVKSASVVGDSLFYTVNDSITATTGLYLFDLTSESSSLLLSGSGYGALTSYGGRLYAVKGNAVMEYELGSDGIHKTNYEISSSSDSVNRLSDATESVRAGSLLVTADCGNKRLSVFDMSSETYTVLPLSYTPDYVATDGRILAAAAGSTVYVYERNRLGEFDTATYTVEANTTVTGIACMYGKCFFVTRAFGYGIAAPDFDAADLCTRDAYAFPPAALTNDLYGNLYVVRSDGSVLRFFEDEFTDPLSEGELLPTNLPASFHSVRADFEGNLYFLAEGSVLYRNGEELASIDGGEFVYGGGSSSPLSFALGFEDDSVYFNFGSYLVKSNAGALGFPTLQTIDASGVHEEISRVHGPEDVQYADVQKGAVGIKVDLSSLGEDTSYFPFDSYARTTEKDRGVLLAEKGGYDLIALYHDRGYDVRLFRKAQCTPVEAQVRAPAGGKYLSSGCSLYNYPCIADAYVSTLPRGTRVNVLSVVSAKGEGEEGELGYDFAYVEAEGKAREVLRGYVPLSFLTDAAPDGSTGEQFELGTLKKDAVFHGESGDVTLEAGTEVRLYTQEDGTLLARYSDERGEFSLAVTEDMLERGESDALRIALIVTLSVLALVIVGAYFALLPKMRDKNP